MGKHSGRRGNNHNAPTPSRLVNSSPGAREHGARPCLRADHGLSSAEAFEAVRRTSARELNPTLRMSHSGRGSQLWQIGTACTQSCGTAPMGRLATSSTTGPKLCRRQVSVPSGPPSLAVNRARPRPECGALRGAEVPVPFMRHGARSCRPERLAIDPIRLTALRGWATVRLRSNARLVHDPACPHASRPESPPAVHRPAVPRGDMTACVAASPSTKDAHPIAQF